MKLVLAVSCCRVDWDRGKRVAENDAVERSDGDCYKARQNYSGSFDIDVQWVLTARPHRLDVSLEVEPKPAAGVRQVGSVGYGQE